MRVAFTLFGAAVLAFFAFSLSSPLVSTSAYASKMNGKGTGCSDNTCRGINSPTAGKKKKGS
jgi:hypothetical protein